MHIIHHLKYRLRLLERIRRHHKQACTLKIIIIIIIVIIIIIIIIIITIIIIRVERLKIVSGKKSIVKCNELN